MPAQGVAPDGGALADRAPTVDPAAFHHNVDILFVISNFVSMREAQTRLLAGFPSLIAALRSEQLGPDPTGNPCTASARAGCAIPNVHLGVISSDLGAGSYTIIPTCEVPGGDGGRLLSAPRIPGCTPPADRYVRHVEGQTNLPGVGLTDPIRAVQEAFSCIAGLGTTGCSFGQALEAARRALSPEEDLNPGFLRDEALLVVVFLSNLDDCSASNPALFDPTQSELSDPLGPLSEFRCFEFGVTCDIDDRSVVGPREDCVPSQDWLFAVQERYVDFLRALKPPGGVILAAIAGPTERIEVRKDSNLMLLANACSPQTAQAWPAIRIAALVDAFAPDSQLTSVCEADFGPALAALGGKILRKLGL